MCSGPEISPGEAKNDQMSRQGEIFEKNLKIIRKILAKIVRVLIIKHVVKALVVFSSYYLGSRGAVKIFISLQYIC